MEKNVNDLVNSLVETARKNLERDGELLSTFFLNTPKGLIVVGAPFNDDDQKDLLVLTIKALAKKEKADWVLFATEAWMAKLEKGKDDMDIRPSEHPNRVEAVIFSLEIKGDGMYMATAEQTLYSSGKKTFGKVEFEKQDLSGRFTHLLSA